jgi:rRNA maturation endonuclease Nob1
MNEIDISEANNAGKDELWCDWYVCPNCKDSMILKDQKFCGECGGKLKWGK